MKQIIIGVIITVLVLGVASAGGRSDYLLGVYKQACRQSCAHAGKDPRWCAVMIKQLDVTEQFIDKYTEYDPDFGDELIHLCFVTERAKIDYMTIWSRACPKLFTNISLRIRFMKEACNGR